MLKVYYCGKEDCAKGHFFGPAVRSHYLVHFVFQGKGIYKTKDKIYEVREKQAFLIQPEEVTYYQADEDDPWKYAWVAFDGEEAIGIAEHYFSKDELICEMKEREESKERFEKLIDAFGKKGENKERILGYFYLIMSGLFQRETSMVWDDEESYYKKAAAFIRNNYSYRIQIQEVADYVGIDRTYLYRIFKNQVGISPKQYLERYRLESAQDMLDNTDYKITEIAYSCGYQDSSAFGRYFYRKMGKTPAEYRKEREKNIT